MWLSGPVHGGVMRFPSPIAIILLIGSPNSRSSPKETTMKEWLKPEITESEAGMEVTSYLPAELDRA
jgi:coenzyme PQQ precursor peptide PqqA